MIAWVKFILLVTLPVMALEEYNIISATINTNQVRGHMVSMSNSIGSKMNILKTGIPGNSCEKFLNNIKVIQ